MVEVRNGTLGSEEDEEEEGEGGGGGGDGADIKSNSPHLTGEKKASSRSQSCGLCMSIIEHCK